uniref:aminodeoxychorismate synthase n=1 Tax=Mucochytrium quahogii TaxID=96639 RepID=A0A7S2RMS4_9STRA|mmetsp:Transcript_1082/g.1242  ORF Transcript_1082/g.1242 Transcript_1082/m.1242 type:complete len:834 (-) Transcript_1082:41-2542(-)
MARRTLLIDNYDSYTFNLYQLIAQVSGSEPLVVQNDDFGSEWENLCKALPPGLAFHNVVVSPGPGSPNVKQDVGLSLGAVRDSTVPVFGVCLGHQLLAHVYGANVIRATEPMHGRQSEVFHCGKNTRGSLFHNVPSPFSVVRYHSLIVMDDENLPSCINVLAKTKCGVIMGLEMKSNDRLAWGVQFHPESIITEYGRNLVDNFLKAASSYSNYSEKPYQPRINTPFSLSAAQDIQTYEGKEDQISFRVSVEKVSLLAGLEELDCSTETLFRELLDGSTTGADSRFWLDSATRDNSQTGSDASGAAQHVSSRFSYMGDTSGPFSKLVEFYVAPEDRSFTGQTAGTEKVRHELRVSKRGLDSPGDWVVCPEEASTNVDIFEYLEADLEMFLNSTALEREGERLSIKEWDLPFPFACGYVGYFGYGLRRLCGVKSTGVRSPCPTTGNSAKGAGSRNQQHGQTKTQPCEADSYVPESSFVFADRFVVWEHDSHMLYLVTLQDENESSQNSVLQSDWVVHTKKKIELLCARVSTGVRCVSPPSIPSSSSEQKQLQPNVQDGDYKILIEECIENIRAGETYEVCLTKQLSCSSNLRSRSLQIYERLRAINPAPYAAFFEVKGALAENGRSADFAICCSSPERFLSISQSKHVESKPIKGTIHRGDTAHEDTALAEKLRTSEKDRSENLMIVDLVRNDIGRVCEIGSVHVPKLMQIESFASVHQLVSTVRGKLRNNCTTIQAIRAAFPGGSMTGAPKLRTMKIIDDMEKEERGVYSGALGFLSITGASDLNIVIRTAILTPQGVSVGTGGAIVVLSDPQEEVDETILKANKLQTALAPFL